MIEQKKKRFKDTLQSAYDHKSYILFIRELLNDIHIVAPDTRIQTYDTFSVAVAHYYHIGNYVGDDKNKIALFSVCLKNDKSLENARSMQRSFIKNLLEGSNCTGALVAFYNEQEPDKWRLSLVRLDYEFSNGKLSEKLTPAKRYSYLVGKDEPCHTALERLFPIFNDEKNPSLDELEEAFSVEAVTEDFFRKYREKYLELKEYLDNNEEFIVESQSRGFDSEQFAKKLMGQIAFLYFIQKKGWLGVNAFPVKLTKRDYNLAFYRRGQKPKEILPIIYKQLEDGYYHRDSNALLSLSAEDESILSTIIKGDSWGSGPKDFVRRIFKGCIDANKNFFDDYLEPLFYTGLNVDRGENAFYQPFHRRIPFLNGGLFEELDGYDWRHNDFKIPNEFFSNKEKKDRDADGLLDILERYNFTMAEDEPMEREVAIDPEMLGKVFENLLDIKDRKSKGAYYTPREIVHYMCQESLINFIVTKMGLPEDDVKKFVLYGEYFCAEDAKKTISVDNKTGRVLQGQEVFAHEHHMEFDYNKDLEIPETILSFKNDINRLKEMDNLLANIKIVDLAVGSGAFPLGMLNEIVKIRNTITSYMAIGLNRKDSFYFHSSRSSYFLKRNTIKNCLFACDIEPSATDITKLRLWLSLVIDNQIMEKDDEMLGHTTKPRPLPNLDCNIICGNSLMDDFCGVPLVTENSALGNLFSKEQTLDVLGYDQFLSIKINELIELQSQLYEAKDSISKETFKEQIQEIYDEIILEQLKVNPEVVDEFYKSKLQSSKPFVIWQLYFPKVFRDNGGFDVIIGNPPYIKIQNLDEMQVEALKKKYCTATGKFDIYVLFVEKALNLLNKQGVCAYIQPHRFLKAGYGRGLRTFLKNNRSLYKVVDFKTNQIFASAITYTGIFFYKQNSEYILYAVAENKMLSNLEFHRNEWGALGNTWVLSNHGQDTIDEKIKKQSIDLLDIFEGIYQGVITLGDDIFIMEGDIRGDLFYGYSKEIDKEVLIEADLMKPILKGEDIKRYTQPSSNRFVFYPHILNDKGQTKPMEEVTLKEKFPKGYAYIEQFRKELEEKKKKYKTNSTYWYTLHRAREMKVLDAEKIITPQLQNYCHFAYDEKNMYPDAGGYMLVIKEKYREDLYYYYGILNSALCYHFIKTNSTAFNNNYYYFKTTFIKPFKFPANVSKQEKERIKHLVAEIMRCRQENLDTEIMEKEIDEIVFSLYKLDESEINRIEVKYCL